MVLSTVCIDYNAMFNFGVTKLCIWYIILRRLVEAIVSVSGLTYGVSDCDCVWVMKDCMSCDRSRSL